MELLFKENVMDLILVLTQHVGGSRGYFRQDNLLLLETFHYIFMGQDSELIAKAHMKGSKVFFFFWFHLSVNIKGFCSRTVNSHGGEIYNTWLIRSE